MSISTTIRANEIIAEAFKIIGEYAEDSNLSGARIKEGLDLLNCLLSQFATSPALLAYDSLLTFSLTIGKQSYTIAPSGADVTSNKIVSAKFITLQDTDIIYPVDVVEDNLYYARRQITTLQRRPTQAFIQNAVSLSTLFFLVKPDKAYSCTVKGKFVLSDMALNTTITNVPEYYYLFLENALGRALHQRYPGSKWKPEDEARYKELKECVKVTSDKNLICKTSVALNNNRRRRLAEFWGV